MTKLTALCFLLAPAFVSQLALADAPTAISNEAVLNVEDYAGVKGFPDVVAAPLPASNRGLNYVEPESTKARRVQANASLEAEAKAAPFTDAFKASFGGYSRELFIQVTRQAASQHIDPTYDAGVNRREFREVYPKKYWEEFDRNKNQGQEDALIARLSEQAEREDVMAKSPAGTAVGLLFDPLVLGLMFLFYKLLNLRMLFAQGSAQASVTVSN